MEGLNFGNWNDEKIEEELRFFREWIFERYGTKKWESVLDEPTKALVAKWQRNNGSQPRTLTSFQVEWANELLMEARKAPNGLVSDAWIGGVTDLLKEIVGDE